MDEKRSREAVKKMVVSQFEIRVSTRSRPDESAQSVGRVARLSRNVRQPNHVLPN